MRYKVNTVCMRCARRFSYWSDAAPELKVCPNIDDHEHDREPTPNEWASRNAREAVRPGNPFLERS